MRGILTLTFGVGLCVFGANYVRGEELAAIAAPLPSTTLPEGTKTAAFDDLQVAGSGRPSFCHAKTLFRWAGQAPNYSTGGPERIVTDRPHFSEASSLVGLGRIQVETGYTVFQNDDDGTFTRTQSFGEPLLRVGVLAEWFEFRLGYSYLSETTRDSVSSTTPWGSDDLYVGAKLALAEQQGVLPEMAIFPQMRVPSGANAFSANQVLPGFNLAYSWMLNDWLELECNSQLNRRIDDAAHYYVEAIQTANLEYELTERFGAFTEWIMFTPSGAVAAQTQHYFHGGFVFQPTPNTQFDIHSAVGLSKASDDLAFTGGGFSFRF